MTAGGSPASGSSGPIDWQGPGSSEEATPDDSPESDDAPTSDDAGAASDADEGATADAASDQSDVAMADDGMPDDASTDDGAAPDDDAEPPSGSDDDRSLEAERDEYLDRLQRLQAEFENYRKRMSREQAEAIGRGSQALAAELLPVLDGCEAAVQQGLTDVEPIRNQLLELLTRAGLEQNAEPGDPFDPERHDAVMHEPAEEGQDENVIAEVLRTGYSWKGRVLRPAMVKVRG